MEKVLIATVLKPQGLNGELKCKLENENTEILKDVSEIFLGDKDVPSRIIAKRFAGGFMYIKLGVVNSREKAEFLRGYKIYANKQDIQIPEDEFLLSEIIGSKVFGLDGTLVGLLVDVQNYGATDIFVIEQYKREYMVPFVGDIFKKVDAKNKVIYVDEKKYNEAKICE